MQLFGMQVNKWAAWQGLNCSWAAGRQEESDSFMHQDVVKSCSIRKMTITACGSC